MQRGETRREGMYTEKGDARGERDGFGAAADGAREDRRRARSRRKRRDTEGGGGGRGGSRRGGDEEVAVEVAVAALCSRRSKSDFISRGWVVRR